MKEIVAPAKSVQGAITLPGDKSISHRYGMLGGIAEGTTTIHNYSTGADCQSTLACMAALGARIERVDGKVLIHGGALQEAAGQLDAGNSGSTIRMLSGILAAQGFTSRIGGDESLSRRPMDRIIRPLAEMGAHIEGHSLPERKGSFPPLTIHGRPLHGIDYTLPMASAQVKSCVLLAGLFAAGDTIVREPIRTRDHTEIALQEFGADIEVHQRVIKLATGAHLTGREVVVPGDLSSAAFFLVAALLMPDANLVIHNVGLNPTRSALLDFLAGVGAAIKVIDVKQSGGELIGSLRIRASKIKGGVIEGALTAALIDEIPALAILGAASSGGLVVKDAGELRVKETDRLAAVATNLRAMGAQVQETEDGMVITGGIPLHGARLDSFGDHRIAMAFVVAGLFAEGETVITNTECVNTSYPGFYQTLERILKEPPGQQTPVITSLPNA